MPIFSTSRRSSSKSGFTIAELMVSVAIMVVITTIVVTGQAKYSEGTLLQNSVSDIALALRQAQVYGVSVKEFTPGSVEFSDGYGLEFSVASEEEKLAYIYFADRGSKNGFYESGFSCPIGGSSECIEKTVLPAGYFLESICEIPTSGSEDCTPVSVDVTFLRPETDARIIFFNSGGSQISFSSVKGARITLESPNGATKSVIVYTTGQVSVQ